MQRHSLISSAVTWVAIFDLIALNWMFSLGDPEVAVGQCKHGDLEVSNKVPAQDTDIVVPHIEDSS